jgi:hypothetical protein
LKRLVAAKHPGSDGVEMDVIADATQIFAIPTIDQQSLVTPAEEMPGKTVTAIELLGVGTQEPLHPCTQVAAGRFHDQMKMIAHHAKSVNLPGCAPTGAAQQIEVKLSIRIVAHDGLTPIASAEYMIDGTRVLDSEGTSHCSRG